MNIQLVTLCTQRKRHLPNLALCASTLPRLPQSKITQEWISRIKAANYSQLASELYCGRGFSEAVKAAHLTEKPLWIISAGMGLLWESDNVPPYDLTLAKGTPNSLLSRLNGPLDVELWWKRLNSLYTDNRSLSQWIRSNPTGITVITLSKSYIPLIQKDIMRLNHDELQKIRIVGPVNASQLVSSLKPLLMPYDERLNGPDSPNPGTRTDFPQRAARHFIELVKQGSIKSSPTEHAMHVLASLEPLRFPEKISRQRLDDKTLIDLISRHWQDVDGSSNRMLRLLRDELLISCEQKRFINLFRRAQSLRK